MTHRRDGARDGRDDRERLERHRNAREVERRERPGDARDVAHGLDVQAQPADEERARRDGDQRRRDALGRFHKLDHRHRERRQRRGLPQRPRLEPRERGELRARDDDAEAVHEADHARLRDEPDELPEPEPAAEQLRVEGPYERTSGWS
eukprot:31335-Pelagococcus_subviridis.AAC.5